MNHRHMCFTVGVKKPSAGSKWQGYAGVVAFSGLMDKEAFVQHVQKMTFIRLLEPLGTSDTKGFSDETARQSVVHRNLQKSRGYHRPAQLRQ